MIRMKTICASGTCPPLLDTGRDLGVAETSVVSSVK